ncbi:MAG TPA: OmpA family protein [Candidatus Kapabacteria bacterium]|nr:OmpA family protein [Candidatus Kapabacteria bacterium]
MKSLYLGLFLFAFLWANVGIAQPPFLDDNERPAYGGYADMNINWHTADFRALPGVPNCCPDFQNGSGIGAAVGLLYESPISRKFSWQLRAGYSWDGATLTSTEGTTVIVNNAAVPGSFQHTVNANIATIGLEPYLKFNANRFAMQVGFRAGYVISKTYSQKEEIVQPSDVGTFDNGQRTRNVYSGDLPNATSFHMGIMSGVSYEFPMNKSHTMFAAPELQLGLGVSPLVSGLTWNSNVVRIGVAIKYIPKEDENEPLDQSEGTMQENTPPTTTQTKPVPANTTPTPAVPPPANDLAATVKAYGVDSSGGVHPDVSIRLEQFRSLQISPLLNYIFFDQDSSSLSKRYVRLTREDAEAFSIDKLHNMATLPLYYQILNIIGKRMRDNPNAEITVTGCNNELGNEKGNTYLSRMRAETVRDYLATTWNIPYSRMKVDVRDLPIDSSDISSPDGIQENRRVEINSNTWEIVQPVITRDTVLNVTPEAVRFRASVIAPAGVTAWSLHATQGDSTNVLKEFSGESAVPSVLEWDLDGRQFAQSGMSEPIKYSLNVEDKSGKSVITPDDSINVNLVTIDKKRGTRVADKEIDHYSLILYKFDRSDLSQTNQRIVKMVKEFITPDATVSVTGYTDRMGDPAHNKDLSLSRAQVAAGALGLADDKAQGVGPTNMYDNNLPEGRFYCRTVDIIVERPVKD